MDMNWTKEGDGTRRFEYPVCGEIGIFQSEHFGRKCDDHFTTWINPEQDANNSNPNWNMKGVFDITTLKKDGKTKTYLLPISDGLSGGTDPIVDFTFQWKSERKRTTMTTEKWISGSEIDEMARVPQLSMDAFEFFRGFFGGRHRRSDFLFDQKEGLLAIGTATSKAILLYDLNKRLVIAKFASDFNHLRKVRFVDRTSLLVLGDSGNLQYWELVGSKMLGHLRINKYGFVTAFEYLGSNRVIFFIRDVEGHNGKHVQLHILKFQDPHPNPTHSFHVYNELLLETNESISVFRNEPDKHSIFENNKVQWINLAVERRRRWIGRSSRLFLTSCQISGRFIGFYKCVSCQREWRSFFGWSDTFERCQRCESDTFPHFCFREYLDVVEEEATGERTRYEKERAVGPHDVMRCKRCMREGRRCSELGVSVESWERRFERFERDRIWESVIWEFLERGEKEEKKEEEEEFDLNREYLRRVEEERERRVEQWRKRKEFERKKVDLMLKREGEEERIENLRLMEEERKQEQEKEKDKQEKEKKEDKEQEMNKKKKEKEKSVHELYFSALKRLEEKNFKIEFLSFPEGREVRLRKLEELEIDRRQRRTRKRDLGVIITEEMEEDEVKNTPYVHIKRQEVNIPRLRCCPSCGFLCRTNDKTKIVKCSYSGCGILFCSICLGLSKNCKKLKTTKEKFESRNVVCNKKGKAYQIQTKKNSTEWFRGKKLPEKMDHKSTFHEMKNTFVFDEDIWSSSDEEEEEEEEEESESKKKEKDEEEEEDIKKKKKEEKEKKKERETVQINRLQFLLNENNPIFLYKLQEYPSNIERHPLLIEWILYWLKKAFSTKRFRKNFPQSGHLAIPSKLSRGEGIFLISGTRMEKLKEVGFLVPVVTIKELVLNSKSEKKKDWESFKNENLGGGKNKWELGGFREIFIPTGFRNVLALEKKKLLEVILNSKFQDEKFGRLSILSSIGKLGWRRERRREEERKSSDWENLEVTVLANKNKKDEIKMIKNTIKPLMSDPEMRIYFKQFGIARMTLKRIPVRRVNLDPNTNNSLILSLTNLECVENRNKIVLVAFGLLDTKKKFFRSETVCGELKNSNFARGRIRHEYMHQRVNMINRSNEEIFQKVILDVVEQVKQFCDEVHHIVVFHQNFEMELSRKEELENFLLETFENVKIDHLVQEVESNLVIVPDSETKNEEQGLIATLPDSSASRTRRRTGGRFFVSSHHVSRTMCFHHQQQATRRIFAEKEKRDLEEITSRAAKKGVFHFVETSVQKTERGEHGVVLPFFVGICRFSLEKWENLKRDCGSKDKILRLDVKGSVIP